MQSTIELARLEGDSIHSIRPLSADEVLEIRNCNKDIFDFNKHFKLVEYVLHNFNALKNGIEKSLFTYFENSDAIGRHDLDAFSHEVNINLLNLMMSARTFLDHMETYIKREYGKESDEIKIFEKLTANEFDSKFSYKFMYKLRNYVQHCGMPPLNYTKTKVLKGEAPHTAIVLEFDRDALLSDFNSWGAIVRPELEARDKTFSATDVIEEFVSSILRIYILFNDATKFKNTLQARARLAEIISQDERYFEDDYCLLAASKKIGDQVTFNASWIPASLFQKIEHYLSLKGKI